MNAYYRSLFERRSLSRDESGNAVATGRKSRKQVILSSNMNYDNNFFAKLVDTVLRFEKEFFHHFKNFSADETWVALLVAQLILC